MSNGSPHPELRAALMSALVEKAPKVDRDRIGACFDFAGQAHGEQRRESGQPFFTHVVEVCRILVDLFEARLDTTLACAALLHDVVEDTLTTPERIVELFGPEIAHVVEGVTKIGAIPFSSSEERQAENFRKMLLAMARDVRVILIKLADRLHNMRTLGAVPPEKRRCVARETLEIYAPLAHRLGMNTMKWELEDLSFATLYPKMYDEIVRLVGQRAPERDEYLMSVKEIVEADLNAAKIKHTVTGRPAANARAPLTKSAWTWVSATDTMRSPSDSASRSYRSMSRSGSISV